MPRGMPAATAVLWVEKVLCVRCPRGRRARVVRGYAELVLRNVTLFTGAPEKK